MERHGWYNAVLSCGVPPMVPAVVSADAQRRALRDASEEAVPQTWPPKPSAVAGAQGIRREDTVGWDVGAVLDRWESFEVKARAWVIEQVGALERRHPVAVA